LKAYISKAEIELKLGEARRAIETLEQVLQIDNQRQEQWAAIDEDREQVKRAQRIGDEDEEERLLDIVAEIIKNLGDCFSRGKDDMVILDSSVRL
jgi:hypothetical protein